MHTAGAYGRQKNVRKKKKKADVNVTKRAA